MEETVAVQPWRYLREQGCTRTVDVTRVDGVVQHLVTVKRWGVVIGRGRHELHSQANSNALMEALRACRHRA